MYEIAKAVASPCGLIWLGLLVLVWFVWRSGNRKLFIGIAALAIAYTILGNEWLAYRLSGTNESGYVNFDPWAEGRYDVVCVLGGAISQSSHGNPILNHAGDRVMLGARLYFRGRTTQLIAAGESRYDSDPDPAKCCSKIWQDLNIPPGSITQVGGRDTTEELEKIQRVCEERGWKKIGLVTSISHMPRVMSNAEEMKFELHPLPSGKQTPFPMWNFRKHLIPNAKGFLLNQFLFYESLGRFF